MKQFPQSILLAVLCLNLAACASNRRYLVPEAPVKAPAPTPQVIGRVSLVNNDAGFALVETQQTPETGTELQVRAFNGVETALLKVSAEKKRPFIIADITKGKPQVGEVVTK